MTSLKEAVRTSETKGILKKGERYLEIKGGRRCHRHLEGWNELLEGVGTSKRGSGPRGAMGVLRRETGPQEAS